MLWLDIVVRRGLHQAVIYHATSAHHSQLNLRCMNIWMNHQEIKFQKIRSKRFLFSDVSMISIVDALSLLLACEAQGGYIGTKYFGQPLIAQIGVIQVAEHRQQDSGKEWIHDLLDDPGQFCLRCTNLLDDPILEPYKKIVRQYLRMTYKVPDVTGCRATYFTSNDKPPKTLKPLRLCRRLGDMRYWREK